MTISTTTTRVAYTGNGITTAFPITFQFFDSSEIEAIERVILTGVETPKTLTTHFTVAGGAGATGTLTMLTAPASTVQLHISRNTARTQTVDYVPNDPFPADTHERALDRLKANVQDLAEEVSRSPKFPKTDSDALTAILPGSVERASKFLGFDALGNAIAASSPNSVLPVSAFMQTLLDDANAAAARATLGVSSGAGSVTSVLQGAGIAVANPSTVPTVALDFASLSQLVNLDLNLDVMAVYSPSVAGFRKTPVGYATHLVQRVYASSTTLTSISSASSIPHDDTIPQYTEGSKILEAVIVPKFADSIIRVRARVPGSVSSTDNTPAIALFLNAGANAIAASSFTITNDGVLVLEHEFTAGSVVAKVLAINVGPGNNSVSTFYVNGITAGTRLFGGVSAATMVIEELRP